MNQPSFQNSHPHYTPEWLSIEMAQRLAPPAGSTILDPACGSGNLLSASKNLVNSNTHRLQYVGIDIDDKALNAAKKVMHGSGKARALRLIRQDFLRSDNRTIRFRRPLYVLMNPPFTGYGALSPEQRSEIIDRVDLSGRFNLAYAFVAHAITTFKPTKLVALLPCTWTRSNASTFKFWLNATGGEWHWQEIEENPFAKVATKVGILTWNACKAVEREELTSLTEPLNQFPYDVRSGTATGCDNQFAFLAEIFKGTGLGTIVPSVRGRDIGRSTNRALWIPPESLEERSVAIKLIPEATLKILKDRSCVTSGRKDLLDFHETTQKWFQNEPKLIVPEIVSGNYIRTTIDESGSLFPLHSTLAIRTKTISSAERLRSLLESSEVLEELRSRSTRLSGNSIRMSVSAIRSVSVLD